MEMKFNEIPVSGPKPGLGPNFGIVKSSSNLDPLEIVHYVKLYGTLNPE